MNILSFTIEHAEEEVEYEDDQPRFRALTSKLKCSFTVNKLPENFRIGTMILLPGGGVGKVSAYFSGLFPRVECYVVNDPDPIILVNLIASKDAFVAEGPPMNVTILPRVDDAMRKVIRKRTDPFAATPFARIPIEQKLDL